MPQLKAVNQPSNIRGARLPVERTRDDVFAKRLQRCMELAELSQSDLAAKIWGRFTNEEGKYVARGRDRISVWVRGKNFPDTKNLEKLAKALNCKIADLAPDFEFKNAHKGTVAWAVTKPVGGPVGKCYMQFSQYVSDRTAHDIQALLIREESEGA